MAANTGERTLIPALIPPGPALIQTVGSLTVPGSQVDTVLIAGALQSLISDFAVRVTPKADILFSTIQRLPSLGETYAAEILLRTLRLNCVTAAYAELWRDCFQESFGADSWTGGIEYPGRRPLGDVAEVWTIDVPLRRSADRRQALLELDVLVALSLGISEEELCGIYRTQFPVLLGYDTKRDHYDAEGRLVPSAMVTIWRRCGENAGRYDPELTTVNPSGASERRFKLPFHTLNREAGFRAAFKCFSPVSESS